MSGQRSLYVNQENGDNMSNGLSPSNAKKSVEVAIKLLEPSDTLFFIGTFYNQRYDPDYVFQDDINDPHIWQDENSVQFSNVNGLPDKYITFKPYDENTKILGDGGSLFRVLNSSYITIQGFNMQGQVDHIPLSTAKKLQFLYKSGDQVKYRVPIGTPESVLDTMKLPVLGTSIKRPTYVDTKGLYLTDVHHVNIISNEIHHNPGNGLRVSDCDYVTIMGNDVHNNSRKSYTGTHGLVVTNAKSFDTNTGYKILVLNNKVHHNYNEIFSWSPQKAFITPRIDEGKASPCSEIKLVMDGRMGDF
jgi:parallel beta-helix repeat protein